VNISWGARVFQGVGLLRDPRQLRAQLGDAQKFNIVVDFS
jgi:hypothetical protein